METLIKIQSELKAPKGQKNNFGGYMYRSCEDILEALKPLLKENDALLTLNDEIVEIGGRIYVKSTANFSCANGDKSATGFAREEESKKGMDGSQVTGAASSYARKYALNALFLIDDNKDSDNSQKVMDESTKQSWDIQLAACSTSEELNHLYKSNKKTVDDDKEIMAMFQERSKAIKNG